MAKYTINHKCGHTSEVRLFGKVSERERKIAWLESQECRECRAKREAEERSEKKAAAEAARTEAREASKTEVLALLRSEDAFGAVLHVPLTGSPKQIEWATDIRERAVAHAKSAPIRAEWLWILADIYASKTEAKWWIDHRIEAADGFRALATALSPEIKAALAARENAIHD